MADTDESQRPEPEDEGWTSESGTGPGDPEPQETPHAETSHEARNMAMLCHLLGLLGFLAPLVIWLSEREKHKFVDEHGREAMNYQVSLMIYYLACAVLTFVAIGIFLLWALTIAHIVLVIVASARAAGGRPWRYPIAIRFLR